MGLSQKVNFKQLPPLTPPYTGGELITKRFGAVRKVIF